MSKYDKMEAAQQEETFEKSLNPMTAKYLNKKITQNDSLAKVDLRNMCENVSTHHMLPLLTILCS